MDVFQSLSLMIAFVDSRGDHPIAFGFVPFRAESQMPIQNAAANNPVGDRLGKMVRMQVHRLFPADHGGDDFRRCTYPADSHAGIKKFGKRRHIYHKTCAIQRFERRNRLPFIAQLEIRVRFDNQRMAAFRQLDELFPLLYFGNFVSACPFSLRCS